MQVPWQLEEDDEGERYALVVLEADCLAVAESGRPASVEKKQARLKEQRSWRVQILPDCHCVPRVVNF